MATKIQVRRDTAANWTSANTVLSSGEMGYETDTGFMKIGDGATAWSSLAYFTPGDVSDDNTTYTISVAQVGADADITLTGSDASTDTVVLAAGTNLTLTVAGDDITMDVDNDLSNYDNTTTAFISNITAEAIGSLSDVDVSSLASGHVLAYDGANWVAGAPAVIAASDLSDVDTTGAAVGSHFQYDGTNWTAEQTNFNSGKTFLSGLQTNRFIEYRNALITIGSISSGDSVDFPTDSGTDAAMEWEVNNPGTDFVANITPGPVNINRSQYFRIIIDNTTGETKGSISGLERFGTSQTVNWTNGSLPVVSGDNVYDIYEFYCFRGDGGSDETWYGTLLTQRFDGDFTGSLFGDDSTLLVDGINNTIPAANLSGALPAIDGSALTGVVAGTVDFADVTNTPTTIAGYGITDAITDVVSDTTPQLGGNLDLNSNDITGTGNVDITSGNVTLQSGDLNVTGTSTFTGNIVVDQGNDIQIKKSVSANNETIGKITATTGSVEYGEIEFKTGADGFASNSEINWYARIGGSKVPVFEIKGTSLGKSGFEINPNANASLDFFMQGATDPTLIFADAGDDRIGFGKIPTQGKVDVDGDVYATTFVGALAFSNLTGVPTTLAGYGITDAATSAQGALADTAVQPAALGNIEFGTGTIDTNDSSAVTITPTVVMSSDATVENSLTVTNNITANTIAGKIVATPGTAPALASDPGEAGEIRIDNNFIYVKTPGGDWKKANLGNLV